MEQAYEIQRKIHEAVRENVRVGMSEKEIAEVISFVTPKWEGDVISGERSAKIEGGPTDRILCPGDALILDIQVFSDGKWSDITRTYFADFAGNEEQKAYNELKGAILYGESILKPGIKACDIYKNIQGHINNEFKFDHHAGHRIGDEPVVMPRFVPECDEKIESGMVVTLEPGIYTEKFGIRLENNYLITENGCVSLFDYTLELSDFILK